MCVCFTLPISSSFSSSGCCHVSGRTYAFPAMSRRHDWLSVKVYMCVMSIVIYMIAYNFIFCACFTNHQFASLSFFHCFHSSISRALKYSWMLSISCKFASNRWRSGLSIATDNTHTTHSYPVQGSICWALLTHHHTKWITKFSLLTDKSLFV